MVRFFEIEIGFLQFSAVINKHYDQVDLVGAPLAGAPTGPHPVAGPSDLFFSFDFDKDFELGFTVHCPPFTAY